MITVRTVVGDVQRDVYGLTSDNLIVAWRHAVQLQMGGVGRNINNRACRRWLNTDDGSLSVAKTISRVAAADALFARVEHRENEIVVARTTPAPVDVEEVGLVFIFVAVAYKRMAAAWSEP